MQSLKIINCTWSNKAEKDFLRRQVWCRGRHLHGSNARTCKAICFGISLSWLNVQNQEVFCKNGSILTDPVQRRRMNYYVSRVNLLSFIHTFWLSSLSDPKQLLAWPSTPIRRRDNVRKGIECMPCRPALRSLFHMRLNSGAEEAFLPSSSLQRRGRDFLETCQVPEITRPPLPSTFVDPWLSLT